MKKYMLFACLLIIGARLHASVNASGIEAKTALLRKNIELYEGEIERLESSVSWNCVVQNSNNGRISSGRGKNAKEAQDAGYNKCLAARSLFDHNINLATDSDCKGPQQCELSSLTDAPVIQEQIDALKLLIQSAQKEIIAINLLKIWTCSFTGYHNHAVYSGTGSRMFEAMYNAQQNCFSNPDAKPALMLGTCKVLENKFDCQSYPLENTKEQQNQDPVRMAMFDASANKIGDDRNLNS